MRKNAISTILAVLLAVTLAFSICLTLAAAAAPAPFEVEVPGSTGYALCGLNLRSGPSTSYQVLKTMPAGTAFVILGEAGDFLHVRMPDSTEGYASSTYIMINLPDVIPSICYNATNSYDSKYRSLGEPLPGITGQALYTSKTMNNRLGYEEYMMPVLYKMAKKIYQAQQAALANGDCLILYEGYRPKAVQAVVWTALDKLARQNSGVYNAVIANPNFGKAYFINSGVGNHQLGVAIDVSLGSYTETTPVVIGGKTVQKPANVVEYTMPSPMHELSPRSAVFARQYSHTGTNWRVQPLAASFAANQPAQKLQKYCTDAGLTPLCSEWWHYNDNQIRPSVKNAGKGGFEIAACLSTQPT